MKIEGVSKIEFHDRHFVYGGRPIAYSDIRSVRYQATITKHSVNGIPTGTSYQAELALTLTSCDRIQIEPDKARFRGLRQEGMNGLASANEVLSEITFSDRVARFEEEIARKGFFTCGALQFQKSGSVFKQGKLLFNIRDGAVVPKLGPFSITFEAKKSFIQKLGAAILNRDIELDISTDRDCILYMLKHHVGLAWTTQHIREKRIDQRKLFYETGLRLGAMICMADGSATSNELLQLKRFFRISEEEFPQASRIFNEQLRRPETIRQVLDQFATEFRDAPELKESLLVGMLNIALADKVLHTQEIALIHEAAVVLGLSHESLARVFAAAGIDRSEMGRGGRSGGRQDAPHVASTHGWELKILGLGMGATQAEIVQAYRGMVRRYHPDVLRGQDLPEGEIKKAEAMLTRVNKAYESLKAAC